MIKTLCALASTMHLSYHAHTSRSHSLSAPCEPNHPVSSHGPCGRDQTAFFFCWVLSDPFDHPGSVTLSPDMFEVELPPEPLSPLLAPSRRGSKFWACAHQRTHLQRGNTRLGL